MVGVLASGPAFGQGTKASSRGAQPAADDVDTRVEKLYNAGVAAAGKKQWEKARSLFEEAFKLKPVPQIAANLGNTELELGRAREAAEHFEYFLREDKAAKRTDREAVQALLERATAKIGTLQVTVDVEGAEVLIDGRTVGKSPLAAPIYVDPGSYTIEARAPGRTPASQQAALAAGAKLSINLKLPLKVADTGPVGPTKPPPAEEPWRTPLFYTSIGLGVVGLGLGIGFTAAAASKNGAVEDEALRLRLHTSTADLICPRGVENDPRCTTLYELVKTRDKFTSIAIGGYALAGLGAAGALALALTRPKGTPDEKNASKVMVVPTLSGMVVSGSF
jgi:hypothetical protein